MHIATLILQFTFLEKHVLHFYFIFLVVEKGL